MSLGNYGTGQLRATSLELKNTVKRDHVLFLLMMKFASYAGEQVRAGPAVSSHTTDIIPAIVWEVSPKHPHTFSSGRCCGIKHAKPWGVYVDTRSQRSTNKLLSCTEHVGYTVIGYHFKVRIFYLSHALYSYFKFLRAIFVCFYCTTLAVDTEKHQGAIILHNHSSSIFLLSYNFKYRSFLNL